jgi:uncharacterized SAM-binding protein YcdF (DUF218 family)
MKEKGVLGKMSIGTMVLIPIVVMFVWAVLVMKGKQFALRDRLRKADAIIVLAGTRGNINFLHGKICTAVHLYRKGWAPYLIFTGKFSAKVTVTPEHIPLQELQEAVVKGRLQEKDMSIAAKTWDTSLGASYMRDQALQMGVPPEAILIENESLHTRENAEHVLGLLKKMQVCRVILVTSPFHQLRTYLTFRKVLHPHGIEIINYYADTGEWHPATWFLSAEHRKLVSSEMKRIKTYREKGDLI